MLLLITPTSGRPKAFDAVKKWIKNQTTSDYHWLIVAENDAGYRYPEEATVIHPNAYEDYPSLNRNILTALDWIDDQPNYDRFMLIEDDDYYASRYIHETNKMFETADLVGWHEDAYYYVLSRKARRCHNIAFAALASTGFKRSVLSWLRACAETKNVFIDKLLWQGIRETVMLSQPPMVTNDGRSITLPPTPMVRVKARWEGTTCLRDNFSGVQYGSREVAEIKKGLATENVRHVGMKENWHGGTAGISQHDATVGGGLDVYGHVLRKWIGDEDAKFYLKFTKSLDPKGPFPAGVLVPLPNEADELV